MKRFGYTIAILGVIAGACALLIALSSSPGGAGRNDAGRNDAGRNDAGRQGSERRIHASGNEGAQASLVKQHNALMQQRINALQARVDQLYTRDDEARPRAASSDEAEPASDGHEHDADLDAAELTAEEHAAVMALSLDDALMNESEDADWHAQMIERVGDYVAAGTWPEPDDYRVQCRSTICRLDVEFAEQSHREQFLIDVVQILEPQAEGFAHIEDEDDLAIEVYLMRGGYTLPAFEI